MKKIIVFIILLSTLTSLSFFHKEFKLLDLKGINKVCFVSDEKFGNFDVMNCGDKYFNFCSLEEAKKNLDKIKNSSAIQLYFDQKNLKDFLKEIKCEDFQKNYADGFVILYGWSPYFDKFVYVDNKKINVEIALKDDKMIAGFPAILTGFWLKKLKKSEKICLKHKKWVKY